MPVPLPSNGPGKGLTGGGMSSTSNTKPVPPRPVAPMGPPTGLPPSHNRNQTLSAQQTFDRMFYTSPVPRSIRNIYNNSQPQKPIGGQHTQALNAGGSRVGATTPAGVPKPNGPATQWRAVIRQPASAQNPTTQPMQPITQSHPLSRSSSNPSIVPLRSHIPGRGAILPKPYPASGTSAQPEGPESRYKEPTSSPGINRNKTTAAEPDGPNSKDVSSKEVIVQVGSLGGTKTNSATSTPSREVSRLLRRQAVIRSPTSNIAKPPGKLPASPLRKATATPTKPRQSISREKRTSGRRGSVLALGVNGMGEEVPDTPPPMEEEDLQMSDLNLQSTEEFEDGSIEDTVSNKSKSKGTQKRQNPTAQPEDVPPRKALKTATTPATRRSSRRVSSDMFMGVDVDANTLDEVEAANHENHKVSAKEHAKIPETPKSPQKPKAISTKSSRRSNLPTPPASSSVPPSSSPQPSSPEFQNNVKGKTKAKASVKTTKRTTRVTKEPSPEQEDEEEKEEEEEEEEEEEAKNPAQEEEPKDETPPSPLKPRQTKKNPSRKSMSNLPSSASSMALPGAQFQRTSRRHSARVHKPPREWWRAGAEPIERDEPLLESTKILTFPNVFKGFNRPKMKRRSGGGDTSMRGALPEKKTGEGEEREEGEGAEEEEGERAEEEQQKKGGKMEEDKVEDIDQISDTNERPKTRGLSRRKSKPTATSDNAFTVETPVRRTRSSTQSQTANIPTNTNNIINRKEIRSKLSSSSSPSASGTSSCSSSESDTDVIVNPSKNRQSQAKKDKTTSRAVIPAIDLAVTAAPNTTTTTTTTTTVQTAVVSTKTTNDNPEYMFSDEDE